METWFSILGWVLSFLAITGNGFTIFLVCSRRNLRTKTNAFIVSLAVADFCVGLSVFPSLFFCDFTNTCHWPQHWLSWVNFIRWLFSYTSVVNLCVLVLDRFIAIVHPLKYITFMTRRHIIQVIFFSWTTTAGFEVLQFSLRVSLKTRLVDAIFIWLDVIFLEFLPSTLIVFSFGSMILRVYKHYRSARTLSKQLRYNHHWVSLKTYHGEKSVVIMLGIVIGVFAITYVMYLHCSFLILSDTTGMASCNDVKYKIPVLVLNSAINPLAYAFFKRDVNKEFRRLISINMFLKKGNQVKPSTYVLDTRRHLSSSLV